MEQAFLDEGAENPVLGPHYFAARAAVGKFLDGFNADAFEPIVKKAADDFYEKLLGAVQNYMMFDAQDNLQSEIWRGVDDSVKALLSGEDWALVRYALTDRYDGAKIRAAIAKLIPEELQMMRIAELEAENKRLQEHVEALRR